MLEFRVWLVGQSVTMLLTYFVIELLARTQCPQVWRGIHLPRECLRDKSTVALPHCQDEGDKGDEEECLPHMGPSIKSHVQVWTGKWGWGEGRWWASSPNESCKVEPISLLFIGADDFIQPQGDSSQLCFSPISLRRSRPWMLMCFLMSSHCHRMWR